MRSSAQFAFPPSRSARLRLTLVVTLLAGWAAVATAQPVEVRQWQGSSAVTRQPGLVFATTLAEWRSLWSRVGIPAPEQFEPGRTNAVGIFLGLRNGQGYSVNLLSAARRRDRIVVVFEERAPAEMVVAQQLQGRSLPPAPTLASPQPNVGGAPGLGAGASSFAPSAGGSASRAAPLPSRPPAQPSSPWAIILINRADLPISVEQRMFR